MATVDNDASIFLHRSVDSLKPFPSIFAGALTLAPPTLPSSTSPPRIRRWNSGSEAAPPRTFHESQRGAHPHLDPVMRAEHLLDHTGCRGTVGPTHVVAKLALRGRSETASSLFSATRNSAHLLNNLRRRTAAEETLRRHDLAAMEWEKRFWLGRLLTEREAAAARTRGLSAAAHARATGGSPRVSATASFTDSLTARLMAATSPSPDLPHGGGGVPVPGLAQNVLNVAGGGDVSRRLSLLSELSPREKGLSPSQLAARKYAPPTWQRVEADGSVGWPSKPPRAPDAPRAIATLSPRDLGSAAAGAVSVPRPDLAQKLLGGGAVA